MNFAGFRVLIAVILGGFSGVSVIQFRDAEHRTFGQKKLFSDGPASKEVSILGIFIQILPVFVFIAMMGALIDRGAGAMEMAGTLMDVMLLLCAYFVLIWLFLPLLRRKIRPQTCATLWVAPLFMVGYGLMIAEHSYMPLLTVYIPKKLLLWSIAVWLTGTVAVLAWYAAEHLRFRKTVFRFSEEVTDAETLFLWDSLREEMEYHHSVKLLRSAGVSAPLSMGWMRRTKFTVLPEREYSHEELEMIFSHELHHLQRRDVATKVFLLAARALCWFNPLVWIATKKAAEDLELSCDEIVSENMDDAQRKAYAGLLLSSAAPQKGFTTCLSAQAGALKYRMQNVLTVTKRKSGAWLLGIVVFCCTMCYGTTVVTNTRDSFTGFLLEDGVRIESVVIRQKDSEISRCVYKWDDAALRQALEGVTLERLDTLSQYQTDSKPWMRLVLTDASGSRTVTLYDRGAKIPDASAAHYTCYAVKGGVDWDALYECMDLAATMPDENSGVAYMEIGIPGREFVRLAPKNGSMTDGEGNTINDWSLPTEDTVIPDTDAETVTLRFSRQPDKVTVRLRDMKASTVSDIELGEDYTFALLPCDSYYRVTAEYKGEDTRSENIFVFEITRPE